MAGKIRVYELARELGLSNKETLDLCEALGIGVKSHSSSIVEPQADRVRRKADAEGLRREVQPEEPAKPKKAAAKKPAARRASKGRAEPTAAPEAPEEQAPPATGDDHPEPAQPAAPERRPTDRRLVTSRPASEQPDVIARAERPVPAPQPTQSAPQAPPAAPQPSPEASPAPAARAEPQPIPPPPPKSASGKPIPPPPGLGGRGGAPPARGPRPSGGRPGGGRPAPGGGGAAFPPAGGARRMPSVPRGAVPGAGGRPGGPGGPGRGVPPRRPRRSKRRRRNLEELQPQEMPSYTPEDAPVPEGEVVIERGSTPKDIAPKLNRSAADVVRFLMQQGEMVTATQSLSDEMIELFAAEIGGSVRLVDPGEEQEVELQALLDVPIDDEDDDDLRSRPPVITVMGHVDHGKTLLLDRIREANVVEGEAGGITQHIGAYQVEKNGKPITFIDTPGHEAFTAMRARGAEATDIVILVVAADDGIMPQTIEALNHAKAADVPIVVAINKIDRENADPNRVRQQLSEHDLVPEEWGGDTVVVEVSALAGQGIDELLENLLVVSELEELRANPDGRARGVVLESNLDVGRGPVANVLVQSGTLRVGDPMVAGPAWGRVRALLDHHGDQVKDAGPSTPVQVLGLSDVAEAGDDFVVAPDDKTARTVGERREHFARAIRTARDATVMQTGARLEDIFDQIQRGETATLSLILKADVNGSLEALTESLRKLERDEVKLGFVHRAVGGITENDVQLAAAANATIIGFNVRPDRKARELAEIEDVEIRTYEIIYQVLEDIENAMVGMLEPELEEIVTGEAEVREIFRVRGVGAVAGCYVQSGVITRGSKVRFLREGTVIWKGAISSLKRFKEDAREVRAGFECGVGLSDFQDLKQGDVIETYEEREIPRA